MLRLFDSANEAAVKELANSLQSRLKEKFNISLGPAKILHTLAEINGHKNWSSLKRELDGAGYWLLNSYAFSGICSSVLAPSFHDGLFAFLKESIAYKRLIESMGAEPPSETIEYQVLAIDEDATYCGLYFYANSRVLCSLARPGILDRVEQFSPAQTDDDLIQIAGIVNRLVHMVGKSEADYQSRLETLEKSIYPRRFEYDAAEYVQATGQREFVSPQDVPSEWLRQTEELRQFTTYVARVTERGVMMS